MASIFFYCSQNLCYLFQNETFLPWSRTVQISGRAFFLQLCLYWSILSLSKQQKSNLWYFHLKHIPCLHTAHISMEHRKVCCDALKTRKKGTSNENPGFHSCKSGTGYMLVTCTTGAVTVGIGQSGMVRGQTCPHVSNEIRYAPQKDGSVTTFCFNSLRNILNLVSSDLRIFH